MRLALLPPDPETIDGWRCPHCAENLPLADVRAHVRLHDCPGCMLELLVVDAVIAEQRQRRRN
ncbi:MAG TPA: hypothetical protein VGJ60_07205 [Chloroflexota bacterium]|jgi:hypothetical protein